MSMRKTARTMRKTARTMTARQMRRVTLEEECKLYCFYAKFMIFDKQLNC